MNMNEIALSADKLQESPLSIFTRVKSRLTRDWNKAIFDRSARGILNTPPLLRGDLKFIALSMVQHKDLLAYIVAIKSFFAQTRPERVVVICDPTITDEDRVLLKQHVPFIEFRHASEFLHEATPRGGTWERLMAITDYAKEGYVVQLDADTITLKPIVEVEQSIREGRSFVIGENAGQTVISLTKAAENAKHWPDRHIQAVAEKRMAMVVSPELHYVRGCSGFTGFRANQSLKEQLVHFSHEMKKDLGVRWAEWGTEQVASNFLVANDDALVLPYPKYSTPEANDPKIVFRHYIGSIRFTTSNYAADVRAIVPTLRTQSL